MKKAGEKAVQTFFSSKRWREGVWIGRREKMDNVVYVSTYNDNSNDAFAGNDRGKQTDV